jgi:hypothetical protein
MLKLQKGYILFTSPVDGACKKGDTLQNSHGFPYSSRHRLLIKLEQAEMKIMSFTRKLQVQI